MLRVRATFFLRCVILAACVAMFVGIVCLGMGMGWTIGTWALALLLSCIGIAVLIEHVAVRRAGRSRTVSSVWFVDLDQERIRERESFHDDTRDNPTIR